MKIRAGLLALALLSFSALSASAAEWTPAKWIAEDTLQFRTECPDEGEYWSYVWLVVLDGDVWVRLGSRAAGRVDCSKSGRQTAVKIGGEEFAEIDLVEVPEMAERVAAAMADKYSTDMFVAWMSHPYTMKLVPKAAAAPEAAAPAAN
ncbi:MAG: hypothetical protein ABR538_17375 [Candidatus Binatia bacterium]